MKFLGWMHRKLMHDSTELMKKSTLGNPTTCFSTQTLFDEKTYYGEEPKKTLSHPNIKNEKYSDKFEANKIEALSKEESFEPFDFLTIGTFGMQLLNTDPPTPTLPMHSENLSNQQTEITENDLKLINYELEKFLETEEKEVANDTSERSSQASIITLSHKPIEGADSEGNIDMEACPLQNYLFATSIELAEFSKEVKKEKTSLGELFKRNMLHDDPTKKYEGSEKPRRRNIAHFMKKVVKKFNFSSSSSKASSKDDDVPISDKKKLSKAIKMFHKKVYPEKLTEKQIAKLKKEEKKDIFDGDAYQIGGYDGNSMVAQAGSKRSKKNSSELPSNGICNSVINGEQWIKTDSDYLVLEL